MFYVAAGVINHTQNRLINGLTGCESRNQSPYFLPIPINCDSATKSASPVVLLVPNNLKNCDCFSLLNGNGTENMCNRHRAMASSLRSDKPK